MIYPYQCCECGATQDVWQKLSDYSASPIIPQHCGGVMRRVFTIPMVAPDYRPFVSHVDGSVINSRSAQREHMIRNGVVLYDDIASEFPARRKAVVEQQFAGMRADVHEAIAKIDQGYKPKIEVADDVTVEV